jgi:hypothetical protein
VGRANRNDPEVCAKEIFDKLFREEIVYMLSKGALEFLSGTLPEGGGDNLRWLFARAFSAKPYDREVSRRRGSRMLILLFLLCFLSTPPCSGLTKVVENKQRKFLANACLSQQCEAGKQRAAVVK